MLTTEISVEKNYDNRYLVSYYNGVIEMSGSLIPYQTGRAIDYSFEPSDITMGEDIYDEQYEKVNEEILNYFYENI